MLSRFRTRLAAAQAWDGMVWDGLLFNPINQQIQVHHIEVRKDYHVDTSIIQSSLRKPKTRPAYEVLVIGKNAMMNRMPNQYSAISSYGSR